jgi:hypothetical protein
VLERRYNTHDQAAKSALMLAFHSLKQVTGESSAEFVDRINAAAMKLEKAGEVVSDAAKLTRLIHPNQGSGSMYDTLGMTIYTTLNIFFNKASGLFEGMEHAGLASVPPADSVNYSNVQDKGHTFNEQKSNRKFNKKKSRSNHQSRNSKRKCPICDDLDKCPILTRLDPLLRRWRSTSSWGEEEGDDGDVVSMITDDQIDLTYSAFFSSSSDYGIVDSGSSAIILQSRNANMVRNLSPSSRSVCTAEPGGSLSISGEGSCGKFDRVLVSDNIRENIISVSRVSPTGVLILYSQRTVLNFLVQILVWW